MSKTGPKLKKITRFWFDMMLLLCFWGLWIWTWPQVLAIWSGIGLGPDKKLKKHWKNVKIRFFLFFTWITPEYGGKFKPSHIFLRPLNLNLGWKQVHQVVDQPFTALCCFFLYFVFSRLRYIKIPHYTTKRPRIPKNLVKQV